MKKGIHPKTQLVIFEDSQTKAQYLTESTIYAKEKAIYEADGKEYPVIKVDVSADSHPFYTGTQTFVQQAGQVDKFNKRYNKKAK
ncbi:MAG: type B 50S ribosomal protein L31 [Acholeplasmataceae bacterium]